MNYESKYLKYKSKYLRLKSLIGGVKIDDIIVKIEDDSEIGKVEKIQPTSIFVRTSSGSGKTLQRTDEGTVWKVAIPVEKKMAVGDNIVDISTGEKLGKIERIQATSIFVRTTTGSGKTLQRSDEGTVWKRTR